MKLSAHRALTGTVIAALCIAGAVACGSSGKSAKSAPSTGNSSAAPSTSSAPDLTGFTLKFADQVNYIKGVFQASGQDKDLPYKIDWQEFNSGADVLTAVNAGASDLGVGSTLSTILQGAAGKNPTVVADIELTGQNPAIVVHNGSPIKTIGDLRGKRVAYTEGASSQLEIVSALKQANMTTADIKPVILTLPNGLAAFKTGQVDAYVATAPFLMLAQVTADAQIIPGTGGLIPNGGDGTINARAGALDDPKTAAAIGDFVRRLKLSYDWVHTHVDEWSQIYGAATKLPPAAIKLQYTESNVLIPKLSDELIANIQKAADLMFELKQITKQVDVKPYFDTRFNDVLA